MLFSVCNEIRRQQHWTWPQLLKEAGVTGPVSKEYEQNFRKGRIHKRKAAQLYDWVAVHRPMRAKELLAALKNVRDGKPTKVLTSAESYRKLLFDLPVWGWDDPELIDEDPPRPKKKPKR
jgi:hypothetical protein